MNQQEMNEYNYTADTSHQLLLALVPDFDERLMVAPTELRLEVMRRACESEKGWRPLHYLRGCL